MTDLNALARLLRDGAQGASNAVASNVSGPVDALAWALRKGGLPIPANPVGGSDWMAQKGFTAQPQNKLAGLAGETMGLLGPVAVAAKAPQIAGGLLGMFDNAMAPTNLSKQAGMIKTPFGRIPETSAEIDKMANTLRRQAERAGYSVNSGASNVSGSRYLTFDAPGVPSAQVRLSNHGDRYPTAEALRFSVDPDSGNTLEVARQWLKDSGYNLNRKAPVNVPEWVSSNPVYMAKLPQAMEQVKAYSKPTDPDYWRNIGSALAFIK